jgi:nitrite reductase/ring-hydroxylating ferredoxin subunit
VKTVSAGPHSFAVTHYEGRYAALSNRCPHQGGPLGEGSIEQGMLRCPWHGYDYCPLDGSSPFGDSVPTFPIAVRDDGIYVGVEPEAPHVRTVTDVMAETMVNWGVRHVFGMVGHSNLGLADALRRQQEAGRLTYIGIRHEGAAAFAASAYGKLTGRPAACLTIAGPGATNLLTGLWDANVDRSPVLALTGQVATQVLGPGAFQEVDLSAAFGKVAHWTQPVLETSKHAELMTLACKHAILQQGPAHLIFPDEVQTLPTGDRPASGPEGRLTQLEISPPAPALEQALDLITTARRPVIIIGHGARFHRDQVIAVAERIGAPVITTFKAKGQIADDHPLACGVLGRSGTPVASWFMNEADLLIVLGASFSNHTGIYPGKPIIQVDVEPLQLGKFHPVEVPVWGEIGVVLDSLASASASRHRRPTASTSAPKSPSAGDLASRKGQPRARRPRPRRQLRGRVRRAEPQSAQGRGDRRRRRQPRLLIRTLLRMQARPIGADVRLPRLDRVRLPGGDWRLGGSAGPGDLRGHGRRGVRPVHGGAADRGQAQDEDHPRAAQQRPARQDQQGAARRRLGGVADLAA